MRFAKLPVLQPGAFLWHVVTFPCRNPYHRQQAPMTDFHDLYVRYADDVYRFALFLSGDASDAEEICAETFARALTGRTPVEMATAKGYLLAIARNLHIEFYRQRKRRQSLSPEIADPQPGLDHVVGQKAELQALQNFLQNFAEVDRSAVLMRADGMAYEEIARVLKISLASAKVKVHRLRLKLAEWRVNREDPES